MKLKNLTILLVEDDLPLLEVFQEIFTEHGAVVLTAKNGIDAFEIFQQKKEIDIIISDVRMPGEAADGITLCGKIRKINPIIPFLLMTGYDNNPEERAREVGANELIYKPCQINDLIEIILKHLS